MLLCLLPTFFFSILGVCLMIHLSSSLTQLAIATNAKCELKSLDPQQNPWPTLLCLALSSIIYRNILDE